MASAAQSSESDGNPSFVAVNDLQSLAFKNRAIAAKISLGRADSLTLPYWKQGDAELEASPQKAARRSLRHHPEVLQALDPWWQTAVRCSKSKNGRLPGDDYRVSVRATSLMQPCTLHTRALPHLGHIGAVHQALQGAD